MHREKRMSSGLSRGAEAASGIALSDEPGLQ